MKKKLELLRDPSPSNPCYADGYFAKSLERKYNMTIDQMTALCFPPSEEAEWARRVRGESARGELYYGVRPELKEALLRFGNSFSHYTRTNLGANEYAKALSDVLDLVGEPMQPMRRSDDAP